MYSKQYSNAIAIANMVIVVVMVVVVVVIVVIIIIVEVGTVSDGFLFYLIYYQKHVKTVH